MSVSYTHLDVYKRQLYELVGEKVAAWGEQHMGTDYSYVGAVVGATYPEMGKVLRKVMPKAYILVPGYGAQGGKGDVYKRQVWNFVPSIL